ncbi:uncharacterized protein PV09_02829 [Verruconis gallopava]|uniref:Peroxisomal membrane protein PEX14 n=1 Tax=Verruconis gallopava TaxID=253628 RepID=A0A0D2AHH9_9PEZI|nr:uncharacterized protein PV09_02829 [Verruconis gallopava]KIW06373.1 hypothetical protein PV09_02829 [Verruconis gallopava]
MAPSDKAAAIPAWQRATSLPGAEDVKAAPEPQPKGADEKEPTHETSRSEASNSEDDMNALREQARKFLSDPSIKDASRERKVAFLESKGLKKEEIELLLSSQPAPGQQPATSSAPAQPARDVPPVVTYPEFLVQPQEPPPLVTKSLIWNTAYAAAGLYGTLYALSKYIINPMQAQLSDARHEFFTHSTNQLDAMNSKLSSLVSTVPPSRPGTALKMSRDDVDDASQTSDPTELFHRDFGTQTSPSLSRRNSLTSAAGADDDATKPSPTERAEAKLKSISAHLRELTASSEEMTDKDDVSKQLSELIAKLNEMAYANSSYYKFNPGVAGYGWASAEKAQDDEIERLVKDIKALKGKFLGVRNFPRAGMR